jgi:hypothetical protein
MHVSDSDVASDPSLIDSRVFQARSSMRAMTILRSCCFRHA